MAFFEWQDSFSVGVATVDAQHRRLIGLINKLHEAIERSNQLATMAAVLNELDTITSVLEELISYASCHFATEEDHMARFDYPEFEQHRRKHQDFIEQVQIWKRALESKTTRLSIEIVAFMRQWWNTHILGPDKRLGAFLQTHGLS